MAFCAVGTTIRCSLACFQVGRKILRVGIRCYHTYAVNSVPIHNTTYIHSHPVEPIAGLRHPAMKAEEYRYIGARRNGIFHFNFQIIEFEKRIDGSNAVLSFAGHNISSKTRFVFFYIFYILHLAPYIMYKILQ